MSSTIEIQKTCEWCHSVFIARKCSTKYCCKRCAERAYKDGKRKEHVEREQRKAKMPKKVDESPFITPAQCADLIGVCRASIYNYLAENAIPCFQFKGKTLIRRESLNALFDGSHKYEAKLEKIREKEPITEFYTTKEILVKFNISNSWLFKATQDKNIPKIVQRGKTLWSKKHIDLLFAKKEPQADITEWHTTTEIQEKFGMTLSAIYCIVSRERVPKKKENNQTFYSKIHFDKAKGIEVDDGPLYYTYQEAMEKYNMTRDQIHHYLKAYDITRVKKGKFTYFSRKEFDNLMAPPSI
ncbi:MAG: helix-turn-helix domain-containing protein [Muribaculaceae bacterium]|nr:helix-turn-helix domain-containing protein [Muribaculaceae bacterium]